MTEQLERDLRQLFAEDADNAPPADGLAERVRQRARRRRNTRVAWGAGVLAAASVAGVVLVGVVTADTPSDARPVAAAPTSDSDTASEETGGSPPSLESGGESAAEAGALPGSDALAVCKKSSPEFVARLDVAFDGTVTDIGATRPDRPGRTGPQVVTTFAVNEWFRGGSAATITVDVPVLAAQFEPGPAFEVGTRLLVSGTRPYVPRNYSVHVWGCGFTRYYDEATADAWRAAFR